MSRFKNLLTSCKHLLLGQVLVAPEDCGIKVRIGKFKTYKGNLELFTGVLLQQKKQLQPMIDFLKNRETTVRSSDLPGGALFFNSSDEQNAVMVKIMAAEAEVPVLVVSAWDCPNVAAVKSLFAQARAEGKAIIFFTAIDSLAYTNNNYGSNARNEASFAYAERCRTFMALVSEIEDVKNDNIVVIVATKNKEQLEPSLVRAGRIDLHVDFHHHPGALKEAS